MKTKRSEQLISNLTEERILQLSNDLSECVASGTVKDWRAVALYFRNQLDYAHRNINRVRPSVAAIVLGQKAVDQAQRELETWLREVKS